MKPTGNRNRVGSLQGTLLAAARLKPEDPSVPDGFEHSVMRRLRSSTSGIDPKLRMVEIWTLGLWQALVPAMGCLGLVGVLLARGHGAQEDARTMKGGAVDPEAAEWVLLDVLEAEGADLEPGFEL